MDGPVPKASDGHPDLSGVWAARGGGGGGRGGAQQYQPATPQDGPPLATFFNIGAGYKEGLPLKPAAAELLKSRMSEQSKDNPDAHCLPLGLMQLHLHPQPRKIIQTPGVIVISTRLKEVSADFHGRPIASRRRAALVVWLLRGKVGRRYPRSGNHWV